MGVIHSSWFRGVAPKMAQHNNLHILSSVQSSERYQQQRERIDQQNQTNRPRPPSVSKRKRTSRQIKPLVVDRQQNILKETTIGISVPNSSVGNSKREKT